MPKTKQVDESEEIVTQGDEYFYPPQDGRDAFVCRAASREEADELYHAAGKKD